MAEKKINLIQDDDVEYTLRQGIAYEIPIIQEEIDEVNSTANLTVWLPINISGYTFFAELWSDSPSVMIHQFALTPAAIGSGKGSYYEINVGAARTTYFFSDNLTRSLKTNATYYFEEKTIDGFGNAVDSVVMKFKVAPEVAKGFVQN